MWPSLASALAFLTFARNIFRLESFKEKNILSGRFLALDPYMDKRSISHENINLTQSYNHSLS